MFLCEARTFLVKVLLLRNMRPWKEVMEHTYLLRRYSKEKNLFHQHSSDIDLYTQFSLSIPLSRCYYGSVWVKFAIVSNR